VVITLCAALHSVWPAHTDGMMNMERWPCHTSCCLPCYPRLVLLLRLYPQQMLNLHGDVVSIQCRITEHGQECLQHSLSCSHASSLALAPCEQWLCTRTCWELQQLASVLLDQGASILTAAALCLPILARE
jgi:hypothetical protein